MHDNVIEVSKQIPCEESEGEFIGIAKIKARVLNEISEASKTLLAKKQFMAYFETALQRIADLNVFQLKAISTKEIFFWEGGLTLWKIMSELFEKFQII